MTAILFGTWNNTRIFLSVTYKPGRSLRRRTHPTKRKGEAADDSPRKRRRQSLAANGTAHGHASTHGPSRNGPSHFSRKRVRDSSSSSSSSSSGSSSNSTSDDSSSDSESTSDSGSNSDSCSDSCSTSSSSGDDPPPFPPPAQNRLVKKQTRPAYVVLFFLLLEDYSSAEFVTTGPHQSLLDLGSQRRVHATNAVEKSVPSSARPMLLLRFQRLAQMRYP